MPALMPTRITGRIAWLGRVSAKPEILHADPVAEYFAGFAGVAGEVHHGLTRPGCVRTKSLYPEGTEIANVRQFSVLSVEELALIAKAMRLESLNPAHLGATMVIEGIVDFSHLPPSSRLQGASGATLVIDMENRPCVLPARAIEAAHPGFGKGFKSAAQGRRGVTAWVEREGLFRLGDVVTLHIPDQPAWAGLKALRGQSGAMEHSFRNPKKLP